MTPEGFVTQKIVYVRPHGVSFGFKSLSRRQLESCQELPVPLFVNKSEFVYMFLHIAYGRHMSGPTL